MSLRLVVDRSVDGKLPPHSLEAEEAVLAAMMIDPRVVPGVSAILTGDHFYSQKHRRIFDAIMTVVQAQEAPLDTVAVAETLRANGRLPEVGGMGGLLDTLNAVCCVPASAVDHARAVHDVWRVRQAIEICHRALAVAYTDYGETQGYLDELRREVNTIADASVRSPVERNLDAIRHLVTEVRNRPDRDDGVTGIATGIKGLDHLTSGLHGTQLTVIGARPGVGKTALLGQWAADIASRGIGVGFISLEMSRKELLERVVCNRGPVDMGRLRAARLSPSEWSTFHEVACAVPKWPLWVDDRHKRNIRQIRESAFSFLEVARAEGKPLGALFVDYLQMIAPTNDRRSPYETIAEGSLGLKNLAKELKIPIIVSAALNRDIDRAGKVRKPRKSDLRGCGNVEYDCDNIIFIHRESRVVEDREEFARDGKADLILDKQRGGDTGSIPMWFEGKFCRFKERHEWEDRP